MTKYALRILLIFVCGTAATAYAQQSQPKSKEVLLTELNHMKDDTNKVNAFVAAERTIGYDHKKFLENYTRMRDLAKKLNHQSGIFNVNFAIANYYLSKAEFSTTLDVLQQNLAFAKQVNSKVNEAQSTKFIALIYFITQDYEQSLSNVKKSLVIFQELKDNYSICSNYQFIAVIYGTWKKYDLALTYSKKALTVANMLKDEKLYGSVHCSLATDYYHNKMYLESFGYCQKAIHNKLLEENELGNAIGILGNIYRDAPDSLLVKMGVKPSDRQQEALKSFKQALDISLKNNNTLSITQNFLDVSRSSAKLNRYKEAYDAYQKHILYRDSSVSVEERKKIAQADIKYQQRLEQVRTVQQRNYFIGGIVILLLISFFIARNYFVQRKLNKIIGLEKQRSDELLINILPADVAEELKTKGTAQARSFDEVSVIFTDFVNFTQVGELLTAQELVDELNCCFTAFDGIVTSYGIEKIKTIGDAYLAVSGLPNADSAHAHKAVKAAIAIQEFVRQRKKQLGDKTFEVRIGIHSGSVVAGIVGVKKFAYDIWGDTVNIAARMEQNSEPGKINVSEKTHELVEGEFNFIYRGELQAKNKGLLKMYFVDSPTSTYKPQN